jgi:hypothetical protein
MPIPNALGPTAGMISTIHTLGPTGTNCEAAAVEWFRRNGVAGETRLYETLEQACAEMPDDPGAALLGCAVYPDLHLLVFNNLNRFEIVDSFVMPTYDMVLASRAGVSLSVVATHPAPQSLVPDEYRKILVTSNSRAAALCADGGADGCITTVQAMKTHGLTLVKNFGPVPMAFTVHQPRKGIAR